MSKEIGFCDVCETVIEVNMCCSSHECGCLGLPTEPPVCSEKCYHIYISKEYNLEKQAKQSISFFIPKELRK